MVFYMLQRDSVVNHVVSQGIISVSSDFKKIRWYVFLLKADDTSEEE